MERVNESNYAIGAFRFESRETYDQAKKEADIIAMLDQKVDLSEPKTALKVYNKFVSQNTFSTVIGQAFLGQLRQVILESEIATADSLLPIPVKETQKRALDTMPSRPNGESKYKRLYEYQKTLNKKFKILLFAACILLIGFVVVTIKTRYSVFTYFTNYKQQMEDEIVDKYEQWQSDLEDREKALK